MKMTAYYIGGGFIFLVLAFFMIAQNNKLNNQISTLSVAHASSTHEEVVSFPLEVKFNRPTQRSTEAFPEVGFNHFDHQEVPCTTCHHTWSGDTGIQPCATAGCHDNLKERNEVNSYYHAYHARGTKTSCVGCHQQLNNEGEAQLPTSPCGNNACHKQGA